ncbi:hypothetical protein D2E25_1407 [Bifidobacterium goeldii]|uniref:Uncharacterized protein n=1 Tax=Bifidobacterium goeldii TaxID=2306975 RepID=A0A430FJ26_9BIFI|nr:hypothetical protein [Bifidobacterium goeldii]RSX52836.1 hypothetical protein D2E25_1407 [Bifidobacterium goeldii]
MQTRYWFDRGTAQEHASGSGQYTSSSPTRHATWHKALQTVAFTGALCLMLSACSAPRIDGRAESEQQPSACETAYYAAESNTSVMATDSGAPMLMRFFAAQSATQQWVDVAGYCAHRFAEGTLRSAQAEYTASILGNKLDITPASRASSLEGITALHADADALGGMAVAEDRAGFVIEVLAARKVDGASLALSDDHKTAGQLLFSLSKASKDPRSKVYDVRGILAHPDTMTDSATGLSARTVAVAEITCAREELSAMTAETSENTADSDAADRTHTDSVDTAASSADTSASSTDTSLGATTAAANTQRSKTLRTLSDLVASRISLAFTYGYPAFDHALFS